MADTVHVCIGGGWRHFRLYERRAKGPQNRIMTEGFYSIQIIRHRSLTVGFGVLSWTFNVALHLAQHLVPCSDARYHDTMWYRLLYRLLKKTKSEISRHVVILRLNVEVFCYETNIKPTPILSNMFFFIY